jgi:hypothetical protein
MSIDALNWAKRQEVRDPKTGRYSSGAKFVLIVLADRADERWSCFPSIELLEAETHYKDRAIRTHLQFLESIGLLRRERSRNAKGQWIDTRYVINPPAENDKAPPADAASGKICQRQKTTHPPADSAKSPAPPIRLNPHREPKEKTPPTPSLFDEPLGAPDGARRVRPKKAPTKKADIDPDVVAVWEAATQPQRDRSSRKLVAVELAKCSEPPDRVLAALQAYVANDPDVRAGRGQPGLHRWIADARYQRWMPKPPRPLTDDDWRKALRLFRGDALHRPGGWSETHYGPPPGEPGCRVPGHILAERADV